MMQDNHGDAGSAGPGSQGFAPEPPAASPPSVSIPIAISDVCGHVAMWAVRQSPYECPANLETVVRALHLALAPDFTDLGQWKSFGSRLDFERYLRRALFAIPEVMAWNVPAKGTHTIAFVTRYSRPAPDYDFIDLDALLRNVCMGIWREAAVLGLLNECSPISAEALPVPEGCAQQKDSQS